MDKKFAKRPKQMSAMVQPSIATTFKQEGITASKADIREWELDRLAIVRLSNMALITDDEARALWQRLAEQIRKSIE